MSKKYKSITEEIKAKVFVLLSEGKSQKEIGKTLNISSWNVFLIKNNTDKCNRGKVVRATGISDSLYNELENISENLGYKKLSHFIKKELPKIRDQYPANMRAKRS